MNHIKDRYHGLRLKTNLHWSKWNRSEKHGWIYCASSWPWPSIAHGRGAKGMLSPHARDRISSQNISWGVAHPAKKINTQRSTLEHTSSTALSLHRNHININIRKEKQLSSRLSYTALLSKARSVIDTRNFRLVQCKSTVLKASIRKINQKYRSDTEHVSFDFLNWKLPFVSRMMISE